MTTSRVTPVRQVTRGGVITRAESWLRPPVPYSQTTRHTNEYGCYRTDCSGYVSMAWALPGSPHHRHGGLDTEGLREIAVAIPKADLLPGDILLRADGPRQDRHVALFAGWADQSRTAYLGYEQAGPTGTVFRTIPYPYGEGAAYAPMRHPALG